MKRIMFNLQWPWYTQIANSHAAADFGRGVALGCLADIGLRSKMPAKRKLAKKKISGAGARSAR